MAIQNPPSPRLRRAMEVIEMEEKKTENTTGDAQKNKVVGILAYFLFFLPFIMAPDSKFGKFHANQSLVLLIIWVASWFAGIVVPVLGGFISMLVGLAVLILWIMGVINAAKGEMKPLPVIGTFTIIK